MSETSSDGARKPDFRVASIARDGYTDDKAGTTTATCMCGAVQLAVPTEKPGLIGTFICHCADCYKLTASTFASNFTVRDTHLQHIRGRDNLTAWGQAETIASRKTMTNYFCKTCGTLMYRVGANFPGWTICRIGTLDDFTLMQTKLRPQLEQFVEGRMDWLKPIDGVPQYHGMMPSRL